MKLRAASTSFSEAGGLVSPELLQAKKSRNKKPNGMTLFIPAK
jgi:hypothetical protein